ncbi:hypothetical protein [uncultured Cedecea sp.]|uniref:hypothetical protein n=1 Tax=uncultured Cedecea sp. TaxID=988762 RepID=UPI0026074408|nr:hypothetical protein [uncultured Cedecea sp.]
MLKKTAIISSLFFFLSGCNTAGNTRLTSPITPLTYQTGSSVFVLKKDCVTEVSSRNQGHNVFFNIKKSPDCSMQFEDFFRRNVGKYVDIRFNDVAIMNKTKIITPLTFENGFSQYVVLRANTDKIIKYYK